MDIGVVGVNSVPEQKKTYNVVITFVVCEIRLQNVVLLLL
jgi:hypothetical protein